MAEYVCSFDAMATFKIQIGASSQYVVRAASASNGWIIDGMYPATSKLTTIYKEPTAIKSMFAPTNSSGCYVLGVKNGQAKTGIAFYMLQQTDLNALLTYMYGDLWLTATDITVTLQKMICDPMDWIASCTWYPFPCDSGNDPIYFGFTNSGVSGILLDESDRTMEETDTILLDQHPQVSRGAYLNGNPYTRIKIDCWGFGQFPIDAGYFIRNHIMGITVRLDLFTGLGELVITGDGGRFAKSQCMMGVPIQLSQVTQDMIKPLFNAIGAAAAIAAEDYIGASAAFINGLSTMLPQVQTSGSSGSKIAYELDPQITITWAEIADEDNTEIGRPLAATRTINTLSGYIKCENSDLDLPASPAEKDTITGFLDGGFYYE